MLASYQQGRTQHILVYQEEGVEGVDGSTCDGDEQQPVLHQIEQENAHSHKIPTSIVAVHSAYNHIITIEH